MNIYTVELTREQLSIISRSLENAARVECGQLDKDIVFPHQMAEPYDAELNNKIDFHLLEIKKLLFPDLNPSANYGIGKGVHSDHMYEMYKQIEHTFQKEREEEDNDTSYNVHSSIPLRLTDKPLIKVKRAKDLEREYKINNILNEKGEE